MISQSESEKGEGLKNSFHCFCANQGAKLVSSNASSTVYEFCPPDDLVIHCEIKEEKEKYVINFFTKIENIVIPVLATSILHNYNNNSKTRNATLFYISDKKIANCKVNFELYEKCQKENQQNSLVFQIREVYDNFIKFAKELANNSDRQIGNQRNDKLEKQKKKKIKVLENLKNKNLLMKEYLDARRKINLQRKSQNTHKDPKYREIQDQIHEVKNNLNEKNLTFHSNTEKKREQVMNVVRKIDIHEDTVTLDKKWVVSKGGFGDISKIYAEYKIFFQSINLETNKMLNPMNYEIKQSNLVIKKQSQKIERKKYFKLEVQILKFIRNLKCQQIASYFLKETTISSDIQQIFVEYYERGLAQDPSKWRAKHVLHFMMNLLEGIVFMRKNKITHRDLKPGNIMLSNNVNVKIIDFGSSHCDDLSFPSEFRIQEFPTTKFYNLKYHELNFECQFQISEKEYLIHPFFDLYSFSKVFETLMTLEKNKEVGSFISMNLMWLRSVCAEQNPNNRIEPIEAYCFLKNLIKIWLNNK